MEVLLEEALTNEALLETDKHIPGLSAYCVIKIWRILLCLEENSYENLRVHAHDIVLIIVSMNIVHNI
jgi:hypothetical protein